MMSARMQTASRVMTAAAALTACAGRTMHHPVTGGAAEVRTVATQPLPAVEGSHLVTTLVEVRYPPNGGSPAHRHPCAVLGYVVEGALRSQVAGQEEAVYPAGASFYEPPNSVHVVSANASSTKPVRFLAWFTCEGELPLSLPPSSGTAP